MLFLIVFTLLCGFLSKSYSLPYGATPIPFARSAASVGYTPTRPPVVPTIFPFNNTPRPLIPAYNHPYYNNIGAPAVPILTYSNDHGVDGSYSFSFTTADGKQVQENGFLKDAYIDRSGDPQGVQVVQGSYAYIAPDGTPIQVAYVADENGFRPSGVHIPSDGKAVLPTAVDSKDNKGIYDPIYNRYNLMNYRSRYNNNYYNQYRDAYRPYDPRYPYEQARYPYDQYRPSWYNKDAIIKEEPKKESA